MGVWTIEVAVQVTDLILQITERKNYAKQSDEQNHGIKISKKSPFLNIIFSQLMRAEHGNALYIITYHFEKQH